MWSWIFKNRVSHEQDFMACLTISLNYGRNIAFPEHIRVHDFELFVYIFIKHPFQKPYFWYFSRWINLPKVQTIRRHLHSASVWCRNWWNTKMLSYELNARERAHFMPMNFVCCCCLRSEDVQLSSLKSRIL